MSAADDVVARLRALPAGRRKLAVNALSPDESDALQADWASWAHDGQVAPGRCEGPDWRTWVIIAGRGFGKTRAGAEWVVEAVRQGSVQAVRNAESKQSVRPERSAQREVEGRMAQPFRRRPSTSLRTNECEGGPLRIALVGATIEEARRVMIEGQSGLLRVAAGLIDRWVPSRQLLRFVGGAEATLYSGASPEALRGPEHHLAWCDELAKWDKPGACWDNLQLGLRLGPSPRVLVTTTPRPGTTLRRIMAQPGTVVTGGPTWANPHLPDAFVETVKELYGGTRQGEQELEGRLFSDVPGALWTVEMIEGARVAYGTRLSVRPERSAKREVEGRLAETSRERPSTTAYGLRSGRTDSLGFAYAKVVIGVDPPSGGGTCGIIVCALDDEGIGHVLADHSITAASPERWAGQVADAAAMFPDCLVVAEANQGGEMVKSVLRAANPALRIKLVNARHGKSARAEPIAMLFEQGRVRLHGRMDELEAELMGMIGGGGHEGPGGSPDRADAMVWALGELMVRLVREPRVVGL